MGYLDLSLLKLHGNNTQANLEFLAKLCFSSWEMENLIKVFLLEDVFFFSFYFLTSTMDSMWIYLSNVYYVFFKEVY